MIRDVAGSAIALLVVSVAGVHFLSSQKAKAPEANTVLQQQAPKKATKTSAEAPAKGGNGIILEPDGRGHYAAELMVDGVRFPAMVDTGASVVALPARVAEQLGIFPSPSQFTQTVSTANGQLKVAPVRLANVVLGPIRLHDVEAVVIPEGRLDKTLLGMSFLGRLKGFEIRDGNLHLSN
jgi:aspartyl protease family protein